MEGAADWFIVLGSVILVGLVIRAGFHLLVIRAKTGTDSTVDDGGVEATAFPSVVEDEDYDNRSAPEWWETPEELAHLPLTEEVLEKYIGMLSQVYVPRFPVHEEPENDRKLDDFLRGFDAAWLDGGEEEVVDDTFPLPVAEEEVVDDTFPLAVLEEEVECVPLADQDLRKRKGGTLVEAKAGVSIIQSEMDMINDGYGWESHGIKEIKGFKVQESLLQMHISLLQSEETGATM